MIFCALAALSARAAEEAGQAKKGEEALKGHVAKSDEDKALVAKLSPTYPLKTCVVSDQELGKMGKPIDYLYEGRLIRFCCPACIKPFEKDAAKYLAMLDKAAKGAPPEKK